MRINYTTIFLLFCACAICLPGSGSCDSDGGQAISAEQKRRSIVEGLKQKQIHVYGKVVDQDGTPVADSEVMIHWEEFSSSPVPVQKKWVKVDRNGEWDFKAKAVYVNAWEAKKDGYLFSRLQQKSSLRSDDIENNRTSPTNRVILRLHKLSDSTFLVKQDGRLGRATPETPLARQFDIFQKKTMPIAASTNQSQAALYPDLVIRVERQTTNGVWRVAYRTPGTGDGLIVTNALLFEAPASGYVAECVLDGVHDQDFPRYLYLRTRTPAVYTRFDMNYSLRPDSFVVSYESSSNPYGARSLEPDTELEPLWQLREQLTKDARTEITAGRRLNKADLQKLVKEAKDKADKGKP